MEDKKMNQSEMLAAIAEAVRRRQAGEDPMSDPKLRAILPKPEMQMPRVEPEKVDPELNAERAMSRAAGMRIPNVKAMMNRDPSSVVRDGEVQLMMDARKGNGINPETGMPFYNAPEPSEAPSAEEDERRQIRMRLLKEASQTGKIPGYLKKI